MKTRSELRSELENSVNLLPAFAELQSLKARMKTTRDIAEKKLLSQELGTVKTRFEQQKKILISLGDLASFEHMIARQTKGLSDSFGSFFQTGKGSETRETVRLIGTPDAELDRDPGLVSGDCTVGKPLPFGRMK